MVVIWGHWLLWKMLQRLCLWNQAQNTQFSVPGYSLCWLSQSLLPIAHPFSGQPKEWDPVQTRFQKSPRDRANGKSRLAFVCYHSNTTAGSIFYSYKKGPLCRGCGVITEKFWGNQILEKQIWETQLLRRHIRLFSHVLCELALIMAAQEGKPGFWANPHCLHWKTKFPGNGEASYFMPPTGLSPKATGELTCFISTHP